MCAFFAGMAFTATAASSGTITVQVDKPGPASSPMLWGIFFEDINHSTDGGIYAEMVRNRNFEDGDKPDHWTVVRSGTAQVEIVVDRSQPVSPKNPRSLKVDIRDVGSGRAGVANGGFWGMNVRRGETYDLSLFARAAAGFNGPLSITLESEDREIYAEGRINRITPEWKTYRVRLVARATDPRARLVISTAKPGTFWLDMVSLFPQKTYKNRPNGLRPDLMEMLAALKPSFNRFPGGCWVEGNTMAEAYRWKQTIGDVSERRTQYNLWGYQATHGIGYHEYLQMCEDLGAEPLFVINCGMSHRENVPMDKMDEFVQDALDAIEYANGPVTSRWGAIRAKNGHPAPFNLKYMQIGNENGGPAYEERYRLMYQAIKARYPYMHIIANHWGGVPRNSPLEIVDEHYYNNPEFFMQQSTRYDSYPRNGYKVFVGEYAVTQGGGQGNLRAAVGEAAFMTGLERNSDVVVMASYAPLFVHVNHRRWNPDLINFDSSRAYGIPSYYVQKMFSENRGTTILPITVDSPEASRRAQGGAIGVGTWLTQAEFKDIKVTRGNEVLFEFDPAQGTKNWRLLGNGNWSIQDGALRQMSRAENVRAVIGDKSWTDYTLSLKARKISGDEGFLILFNVQDENAKSWWNIGGWGNQRHAIEMGGVVGREVNGRIETDRWYDIRIETSAKGVKCYLDGKLIHDSNYPTLKALYASATKAGDDVIIKVVNASYEPLTTTFALQGVNRVQGPARWIVLTSEKDTDENSLENPLKVSPVTRTQNVSGPRFDQTLAPNSVNVLRVRVQ